MTIASRVAAAIGIPPANCRRIAMAAHRRYKIYLIPKKKFGEFRRVAQPAREVKAIQRALVAILSPLLPIHEAATAYRPGTSILKNAQAHIGSKFLTKLDFSNFFPSINAAALAHFLRGAIPGIQDSDVAFIVSACLWRGDGPLALCVGAPSSPFLSNAIMFKFDTEVSCLANAHGCVYTRYSDDIALSASEPNILAVVEAEIREIVARLEVPTLAFNESKRLSVGRSTALRVTGLTLSNQGNVTVGRARKRGVRAGVDRFIRGGMPLEQQVRLEGELAFVLSIEPEFRAVLHATYGEGVNMLLPGK